LNIKEKGSPKMLSSRVGHAVRDTSSWSREAASRSRSTRDVEPNFPRVPARDVEPNFPRVPARDVEPNFPRVGNQPSQSRSIGGDRHSRDRNYGPQFSQWG